MNGPIIGGIYLTPKDNYLVVINHTEETKANAAAYNLACFNKDKFTQKKITNKMHITQNEKFFYYINDTDYDELSYYFTQGYCGRITDELLRILDELMQEGESDFINAENLIDLSGV